MNIESIIIVSLGFSSIFHWYLCLLFKSNLQFNENSAVRQTIVTFLLLSPPTNYYFNIVWQSLKSTQNERVVEILNS